MNSCPLDMDIITSTQNKRVKYAKALQTKARLRRSEMKLILEGKRLIRDALMRGGHPDFVLYSPKTADYDLIAQLQSKKSALVPVSEDILKYVSDTQQAAGILAVFYIPKPPLPHQAGRVLVMDGIREPGNMGTILRTAAAAAVDIAVLSPGCVDPYNSKALRAGMGAHFRLPVVEAPWNEIRSFCRALTVYASRADAGTPYTEVDWSGDWALIVGSEAHGISQQARKMAQKSISIPMQDATESLNAAVAAAVVLFEAQRQRLSQTSKALQDFYSPPPCGL